MEIHINDDEPDVLNVSLSGSFGFQDHMIFNDFIEEIQDQKKSVIFDLQALEMIDSAGIGMLFLAHKTIEHINGDMVLKNPKGQVKRVFDLTSLDQKIKVVTD